VNIEDLMVQTEKMASVGGLAAGMAHEINNPLGGIIQNVQNIARRLSGDHPKNHEAAGVCGIDLEALEKYLKLRSVDRMLGAIGESGRRAAEIVSHMLSFSRRGEAELVPSNLSDILERALGLVQSDFDLQGRYDFKRIEVIKDYAEDLPLVTCQPTKMEQVFLNLLNNSAQAMREVQSDGPGRLILRTWWDGDMVMVEVEDNGPGMNIQTRKRAFEPFYTTKDVGKGTGLGLSVAYFIVVDDHGGRLELDSTEGEGSKFTVCLPLALDDLRP
jgi:signal transduction histidine kinase